MFHIDLIKESSLTKCWLNEEQDCMQALNIRCLGGACIIRYTNICI